ncbi:LOW QUALITY PROTEIN: uncharacterized protein ACJ7VT_008831 [Polymixia lowei]
MAEKLAIVERYLNCHVCSETFRDPVSLSCHHSFCLNCLQKFWEQDENKNCPICKRRYSKHYLDVNLALKELADSYTGRQKAERDEGAEKVEVVCSKHPEYPKLFCEEEQRAVCHVCDFPHHQGHKVVPIEQAVSDLKDQLKTDLKPLQDKRNKYKEVEKTYNEVVQYSKKQLVDTERKIRAEFEKLHQFLREEEDARLAALREEEEQKRKTIVQEMKIIQEQISSLSDRISAVEQDLQKHNMSFLSSYKHTQTRARAHCSLSDPQLVSGALIDVAKHLGNLSFRVWEKMKRMIKFTPVILDPNTAAPCLFLSDDLTSVRCRDNKQHLPDIPERNTRYAIVLGSEGFSSGEHSWEVEVGDHPDWLIGLAKESVDRKREQYASPKYGFWCLTHHRGKYINGLDKTVKVKRSLQRIRVQLDYNKGKVSFYDPEDMTHIYTYKDTFTEKLYPYFFIGESGDAKTIDIKVCQTEASLLNVYLDTREMAEKLACFLNCHKCSEIFRDPVSLSCNHNFCSTCLTEFWEKAKNKNCPICKRKSSKQIIVNFTLKELADSYAGRQKAKTDEGAEKVKVVCSKHPEDPKLFCEEEQRAVCHVCDFPHHQGHKVVPIEQAVSDLKDQLKSDLKPLQDKMNKYKEVEKTYNEVVQYSKKQLVDTERKIRAEFEKLHQFLREEEEARLAALREEEEQKGKTITQEMKIIQEQISSLSDMICAVEQDLQKHNVSFLSSYKHTQTRARVHCSLSYPQLVSGALIDVAKHLGNLSFRVWEKMKETVKFTPVILDPNTANCCLSLSDDLTSVRDEDTKQLPDIPERNTWYSTVLGSEGFSSGEHSWDVEVGDHPSWNIGLAKELVERKGKRGASPEYGVWSFRHRNGKYTNGFYKTLTVKRSLHRIRVQLDYDKGKVSFYDPEDMTHIYTHKDTFPEKLYPYFSIGKSGDAKTIDIKVCQTEASQ